MTTVSCTSEDKAVLWAVYTSEKNRTPEICLAYTRTLIESADPAHLDELCTSMASKLFSVAVNRGSDMAFIDAMLTVKHRRLALGCVGAMTDMVMRGRIAVDLAMARIETYVENYGEDAELLLQKLRLLVLHDQYPQYVQEAERIFAALQPAAAGAEV